jgi:NTP pyrophosphatase (non-canonical NTP hydrolase)
MMEPGSLHEWQEHFWKMYRARNRIVNESYAERSNHFYRRLGRLGDAYRKDEMLVERLGRTISYFMSLVNAFYPDVSIARGMARKFPKVGCVYCRNMPCACNKAKRPTPTYDKFNVLQYWEWNIRDYQQLLDKVYGERNRELGFHNALARLVSEVGEISILNALGPDTPNNTKLIHDECELELADILSWIIALAYTQNIDLQSVVLRQHYCCPGCNETVCACPPFFIDSDAKTISTTGTRPV